MDGGAARAERAPAKVNLDLLVTGRRHDGYHELDSLVVFTGALADDLAAEPADDLTLVVAGPFAAEAGGGEDNLVLRAARRLAETGGVRPGARLTLDKRVWVAAGLGGGSADAAAALRLLNRLWRLGADAADLCRLGGEVGADVPGCVLSRPLRMRGKGERLEPLDGLPVPALLLVNPGVAVPTAAVFRRLERYAPPRGPAPIVATDAAGLADLLRPHGNGLEAPARALAPAIDAALDALAGLPGCRLARMSGSGATCFGLFDDPAGARAARDLLAAARPGWRLAAG